MHAKFPRQPGFPLGAADIMNNGSRCEAQGGWREGRRERSGLGNQVERISLAML